MMRLHPISHHIGHALILAGAGLCMTAYLLGESRAAQDQPGRMDMDHIDQINQINQIDEGEPPFIPAQSVPITN